MADLPLTKELILDTAEEVLRKYGPAKTTVKDVARALDVSHAALYRHFGSKTSLRDAVTERWLDRLSEPLNGVVRETAPPDVLLRRLVEQLSSAKQQAALADPELFATYAALVEESREVLQRHIGHVVGLLAEVIAKGIEGGAFAGDDPKQMAEGVFWATTKFHHPAFAHEWGAPGGEEAFHAVWTLLLQGLASRK